MIRFPLLRLESLTSFEDATAILDALTGDNCLMFVSAIVAAAIILARASAKRIKVPWYRTGAVLGFIAVASLVSELGLG